MVNQFERALKYAIKRIKDLCQQQLPIGTHPPYSVLLKTLQESPKDCMTCWHVYFWKCFCFLNPNFANGKQPFPKGKSACIGMYQKMGE